MKAFCIFCKSGSECTVAKKINELNIGAEALVPIKAVQEKRKGIWQEKNQILLPGYVFLYANEDLDHNLKGRISNIYKILQYQDGAKELTGSDYEYAMWVNRNHGSIKTSRVFTEGKEVKVVEGPLIDICGKIMKLDKHKRKVWVEIDFCGQKKIISLSVECITELKEK